MSSSSSSSFSVDGPSSSLTSTSQLPLSSRRPTPPSFPARPSRESSKRAHTVSPYSEGTSEVAPAPPLLASTSTSSTSAWDQLEQETQDWNASAGREEGDSSSLGRAVEGRKRQRRREEQSQALTEDDDDDDEEGAASPSWDTNMDSPQEDEEELRFPSASTFTTTPIHAERAAHHTVQPPASSSSSSRPSDQPISQQEPPSLASAPSLHSLWQYTPHEPRRQPSASLGQASYLRRSLGLPPPPDPHPDLSNNSGSSSSSSSNGYDSYRNQSPPSSSHQHHRSRASPPLRTSSHALDQSSSYPPLSPTSSSSSVPLSYRRYRRPPLVRNTTAVPTPSTLLPRRFVPVPHPEELASSYFGDLGPSSSAPSSGSGRRAGGLGAEGRMRGPSRRANENWLNGGGPARLEEEEEQRPRDWWNRADRLSGRRSLIQEERMDLDEMQNRALQTHQRPLTSSINPPPVASSSSNNPWASAGPSRYPWFGPPPTSSIDEISPWDEPPPPRPSFSSVFRSVPPRPSSIESQDPQRQQLPQPSSSRSTTRRVAFGHSLDRVVRPTSEQEPSSTNPSRGSALRRREGWLDVEEVDHTQTPRPSTSSFNFSFGSNSSNTSNPVRVQLPSPPRPRTTPTPLTERLEDEDGSPPFDPLDPFDRHFTNPAPPYYLPPLLSSGFAGRRIPTAGISHPTVASNQEDASSSSSAATAGSLLRRRNNSTPPLPVSASEEWVDVPWRRRRRAEERELEEVRGFGGEEGSERLRLSDWIRAREDEREMRSGEGASSNGLVAPPIGRLPRRSNLEDDTTRARRLADLRRAMAQLHEAPGPPIPRQAPPLSTRVGDPYPSEEILRQAMAQLHEAPGQPIPGQRPSPSRTPYHSHAHPLQQPNHPLTAEPDLTLDDISLRIASELAHNNHNASSSSSFFPRPNLPPQPQSLSNLDAELTSILTRTSQIAHSVSAARASLRRHQLQTAFPWRASPFSLASIGEFMTDEELDMSYDGLISLATRLGAGLGAGGGVGVGSGGTPRGVVEGLVRRTYGEVLEQSGREREEMEERCGICLESYNLQDETLTSPCNHFLHRTCFEQWLRTSRACPVCRGNVVDLSPSSNIPIYSPASPTYSLASPTFSPASPVYSPPSPPSRSRSPPENPDAQVWF